MKITSRVFAPLGLFLLAPLARADGWLGITVEELDQGGVAVVEVAKNGPADEAGVKKGDVIVKYNGRKIGDLDALAAQIGNAAPGDFASLSVRRGKKELVLRVKLGDRKMAEEAEEAEKGEEKGEEEEEEVIEEEVVEAPPRALVLRPAKILEKPQEAAKPTIVRRAAKGGAFLGVRLASGEDGRVNIDSVVPRSAAARIGMQAGETIRAIDGKKVTSAEQIVSLVRSKKPGDQIQVKTSRGAGEERSEYTYVFNLGKAPAEAGETMAKPKAAQKRPRTMGGIILRKPAKRAAAPKKPGAQPAKRAAAPKKSGAQPAKKKVRRALRKNARPGGLQRGVDQTTRRPATAPATRAEIQRLRKEIQAMRSEMRQLRKLMEKMAQGKGER